MLLHVLLMNKAKRSSVQLQGPSREKAQMKWNRSTYRKRLTCTEPFQSIDAKKHRRIWYRSFKHGDSIRMWEYYFDWILLTSVCSDATHCLTLWSINNSQVFSITLWNSSYIFYKLCFHVFKGEEQTCGICFEGHSLKIQQRPPKESNSKEANSQLLGFFFFLVYFIGCLKYDFYIVYIVSVTGNSWEALP